MAFPTGDRDRVRDLLKNGKHEEALKLASDITDPWFKCQSLAYVARKMADNIRKSKILAESFQTAKELLEPNRIVAVSSWPLSFLSEFGKQSELDEKINELLTIINTEPHPIRRNCGLFDLIMALSNGPKSSLLKICDEFIGTSKEGSGWKRDRNIKEAAFLVKKFDINKAKEILALIEKPIKRDNALKKLENTVETDDEKGLRHSIDYRYGIIEE